jgi:hypothetical protein
VLGGASQFFDKSFYLYSGSESTPPCKEGLIRILMKTTIKVTAAQLQPLLSKSYDPKVDVNGNARDV